MVLLFLGISAMMLTMTTPLSLLDKTKQEKVELEALREARDEIARLESKLQESKSERETAKVAYEVTNR